MRGDQEGESDGDVVECFERWEEEARDLRTLLRGMDLCSVVYSEQEGMGVVIV